MKVQIPASKAFLGRSVALYTSITGKRYVVPAWIEVSDSIELEDIEIVNDIKLSKTTNLTVNQTFQVKGSTGKLYIVSYNTMSGYSCNCVGYGFHRSCKHIHQIQKQYEFN